MYKKKVMKLIAILTLKTQLTQPTYAVDEFSDSLETEGDSRTSTVTLPPLDDLNNSTAAPPTQKQIDAAERIGILYPESTRLRDYNTGKPGASEMDIEHIKTVYVYYYNQVGKQLPDWRIKKTKPSPDEARAIGAMFIWLNYFLPTRINTYGPGLKKLLAEELISKDDLRLDNLDPKRVIYNEINGSIIIAAE